MTKFIWTRMYGDADLEIENALYVPNDSNAEILKLILSLDVDTSENFKFEINEEERLVIYDTLEKNLHKCETNEFKWIDSFEKEIKSKDSSILEKILKYFKDILFDFNFYTYDITVNYNYVTTISRLNIYEEESLDFEINKEITKLFNMASDKGKEIILNKINNL